MEIIEPQKTKISELSEVSQLTSIARAMLFFGGVSLAKESGQDWYFNPS